MCQCYTGYTTINAALVELLEQNEQILVLIVLEEIVWTQPILPESVPISPNTQDHGTKSEITLELKKMFESNCS